jgi:3-keto-disaccharide hydrolase
VKIERVLLTAAIAIALALSSLTARAQASSSSSQSVQAADLKAFLGRWDLTLKAPDREYPSWIEIQQQNGQLTAQFVGRWGNARPLPKIEVQGTHITFVSPKEEEDRKEDMVFDGALSGKTLSGTTTGQDGTPWRWTGVRAPDLDKTGEPKWGKPIELFNGKDLTGWKMSAAGPPTWTVQDGNLVSPGNGPEIITDIRVQDFKLHIEFNCGKESNSGVYLRGRYEVQIETDSVAEPPSHHTGGVYGFLAPSPEQPRTPDTWQTFDITLVGRRVTVVQNGKTVINNQEIPGITGGALNSHESLAAPIYLQGSEKGHVAFRKITLTPAG